MHADETKPGTPPSSPSAIAGGERVVVPAPGASPAESETQYREVVEASIQGIGIVQSGRLRYANPTLARMFGYSGPEELVGIPWESLAAAEEHSVLRARIEACERGQVADLHPGWQGMRKDGTHLWVESVASPIAWNGRPAVLSMVLDITQRKRLEEQFRQSQKMEAVGRLAGGIAHDFNNLLTVIIGYTDIVRAALPTTDPLNDPLEQIQKAGERAALLTRQLLVFSRKQVLQPVTTDLNAVLADMEKMLARLIGEDIDLRVALGTPLWQVKTDPGQIEQVIMNLVVNARDAMPRGGKLTIETANLVLGGSVGRYDLQSPARDYVLLAVSDTGCGMDNATKARIFEPFFTTKGPEHGTGLGLATVYGIIQQSGGRIAVYSEVGIGTSFKVYLPRDLAGDVADPPQAVRPTTGLGSETVLLVEDDEQVRALARLVLGSHGYTLIEARDGAEALRLCAQHPGTIHLMVTDIIMPNLSGRQLAEKLQALHPSLRVLFLSGYTDDAVVHHGVLEHGAAFLQKPFVPEALARKVREMLDVREPTHA
jgi:two-component system, cell cycle sensor histidine kinase and response regulator CckA